MDVCVLPVKTSIFPLDWQEGFFKLSLFYSWDLASILVPWLVIPNTSNSTKAQEQNS